jgi:hypothetical protein
MTTKQIEAERKRGTTGILWNSDICKYEALGDYERQWRTEAEKAAKLVVGASLGFPIKR